MKIQSQSKMLKSTLFAFFFALTARAAAQEAVVNVVLHPAGSFKAKTSDVKGSATKKADGSFEASNIVVDLRNIQTGVELRDTHTKKHLETEKFPEATLVSATGKDGKGEGTIRIRGVEQKITGTYEVDGNKLTAHFPLQLSDFKIDGIKYMGIGVDNEVKLDVTVLIGQAASAPAAAAGAPATATPDKH